MRILFVRPDFDVPTHWVSEYLGREVGYTISRGHWVRDLHAEEATPENVVRAVEVFDPELMILLGHGSPAEFTVQHKAEVMRKCSIPFDVTGRKGYFTSCLVGQELGPDLVDKGLKAFVGYTTEFIFTFDPGYWNDPSSDPRARPFLEPAMVPVRYLVDGRSHLEAYWATVRAYNSWIDRLYGMPEPEVADMINYLAHDRDGLIALPGGPPPAPGIPWELPVAIGVTALLVA